MGVIVGQVARGRGSPMPGCDRHHRAGRGHTAATRSANGWSCPTRQRRRAMLVWTGAMDGSQARSVWHLLAGLGTNAWARWGYIPIRPPFLWSVGTGMVDLGPSAHSACLWHNNLGHGRAACAGAGRRPFFLGVGHRDDRLGLGGSARSPSTTPIESWAPGETWVASTPRFRGPSGAGWWIWGASGAIHIAYAV